MTNHVRRRRWVCPYCGRHTDCDTEAYGDGVPEVGDVSVCFYCAGVGIYTADGVRLPTDSERVVLLTDAGVVGVVSAVLVHLATTSTD